MEIENFLWQEESEKSPEIVRQCGVDLTIPHIAGGIEDELIRLRVIAAHNAEIRRLWQRIRPKDTSEGLEHE